MKRKQAPPLGSPRGYTHCMAQNKTGWIASPGFFYLVTEHDPLLRKQPVWKWGITVKASAQERSEFYTETHCWHPIPSMAHGERLESLVRALVMRVTNHDPDSSLWGLMGNERACPSVIPLDLMKAMWLWAVDQIQTPAGDDLVTRLTGPVESSDAQALRQSCGSLGDGADECTPITMQFRKQLSSVAIQKWQDPTPTVKPPSFCPHQTILSWLSPEDKQLLGVSDSSDLKRRLATVSP